MLTLWQDLRYGMRLLLKSPGFTTIAVLTLALGIGGNTAIFTLIDAVMLRSLPVRDPQQLVLLSWAAHKSPKYHMSWSYGDCGNQRFGGANPTGCSFSHPFVNAIRSKTNLFSGLAAFGGAGQLDLAGNGPASLIKGQYVSGDFFQTLGVQPAIGRTIAPEDDAPSASPVVVLNYGYWQRAFGGSPSAVGKTIRLNGVAFTIVGVAEPKFISLTPGNVYDAWVPLSLRPSMSPHWDARQDDAGSVWLVAVVRLKPETPRAQAQAALSLLFRNELLHGEKPLIEEADNPVITLAPAQEGLAGPRARYSTLLHVLMLAVGIVLLIACANVAGLLLSRAAARQKEIAVRLALGAGRARILRQLLTESVLLSVSGGVLGILLAQGGVRAILQFVSSAQSAPLGFVAEMDWRILSFTAGISVLTGVLFGLAPAFRGMRVDLTPALKEAGGGHGAARARIRWFNAANSLVVIQVALTIVVLVGAGLLVRTLQNLKSIDPGFDTRSVLTFGVDATLSGYKGAKIDGLYRDLQDQLAALPGVISSSYSMGVLLGNSLMRTSFHLPGTPADSEVNADMLPVGLKFFQTMRIPFVAGRDFSRADLAAHAASDSPEAHPSAPIPAVVNETFVHKYFDKVDPIGQLFGASVKVEPGETPEPGWHIIGVVRDAKYNSLRREINPTIYVPPQPFRVHFELRTAVDPSSLIPAVRSVVSHLDDNLPVFDVKTESETIDRLLFQERFIARLSSFFGVLALVLACVGLYGLLSYEVARRTREIGVRMALGAQHSHVLRLVVGHGIALALTGTAVGAGAAFGVTRFLASLLYDVRPGDPLTLAGVSAILLVVALAACYSPARRATRVDPMVALRYE
jgi:predicted permease